MSLQFSTKLRNTLLSGAPALRSDVSITGTTIAAVDGGAGADSFTDSGNGFLTAGFTPGDTFLSHGWTTGGANNNNKLFTIVTAAAGVIEVATGLLAAKEAGDTVVFTLVNGSCLRDIFKDGVIKIYSGTQPVSADAAITGSLLATLTLDSGAWVAGAHANGLEFGLASAGVISKDSGVWSGTGLVLGIAGWYRFYANPSDTGALDSGFAYPRIDGAIGTSGAQITASATNIAVGANITLSSYSITMGAEGA